MAKDAPKWPAVGSVEVEKDVKPGEAPTRRLAICPDKLVTQPLDGITTVCDVIAYSARVHGSRDALGWRDVTDIHEEEKEITKNVGGKEVKEKKKWKYFEVSGCASRSS